MNLKMSAWLTGILFCCLFLQLPVTVNADATHIRSAGCKTEFFLMKDLAASYQKKTGQKLRTASTGNKKAVDLMLDGNVDFAFTCKPIGKLSKKLKLNQGKIETWKSIPIARDPIVVVSNVDNGISDLSLEQLTQIFQGGITRWSEVGGATRSINVAYIDPKLESGSLLLFKEFTVGVNGTLAPGAKTLGGPSMLGNYVSSTAGGITFMSLNSYRQEYGAIVAIDGVIPSRKSIENGSYRLAATYFLTIDQNRQEGYSAFVDYCMSGEGRQIIAENFIPYSQ